MQTTRWQPFAPVWQQLNQFQSEMNRLFDRYAGNGGRLMGVTAYPALNLWEDADWVYVEAELPGLELKDLDLQITGNNQLSIKGQRKPSAPEKCVWHRQERGYGSFSRVLTLPFDIDASKVEAKLEHGILHIKLAKHATAKPRKIPVKAE